MGGLVARLYESGLALVHDAGIDDANCSIGNALNKHKEFIMIRGSYTDMVGVNEQRRTVQIGWRKIVSTKRIRSDAIAHCPLLKNDTEWSVGFLCISRFDSNLQIDRSAEMECGICRRARNGDQGMSGERHCSISVLRLFIGDSR